MSKVAEVFETLEYGPAPEGPERAHEWLQGHGHALGHFIAGNFTSTEGRELFETANPATGRLLARVVQGSVEDVDRAVAAARAAQPAWWALGPHGRARHLYALARQVQRQGRLLAVLETLDNGKPIRESRDLDVPLAARHLYHHAGWAQLMEAELPGHVPLGVVGQIIPWSFPLLMVAWKVAPALATGNTVVLKPDEATPLTALLFAELARDAGLPPGVLNVLCGDGRTGAALVGHPGVDKIAFTGSPEVGRHVREATAGSGKRLTLELGGRLPFVVFDDADLDSAVEGVVDAIWSHQGQVCRAGSHILAQEGIAEALKGKLRARMETLRMGDPLDESVDMGAVVGPVRPAGTPSQVEISGPVAAMMTFRTPAEAVELANDTRYGLAASVWSESINLALDVAPKLNVGTVWINCANVFDAASGFGGYRESGFGREGGLEGLWEYLRLDEAAPRGRGRAARGVRARSGRAVAAVRKRAAARASDALPPVDRTAKLYIGGKQVRPDGDTSLRILAADGSVEGEVGRGSRKDIVNAVDAARKAQPGWAARTAHNRAQILYCVAESLSARREEFAARLASLCGNRRDAVAEVAASVSRLFTYGAWADKWDGKVHATPHRGVTLAINEPLGVVGVVCPDERPLLALISLLGPVVATGNAAVVVPSRVAPLLATDLYQVLDMSDVPGGVVNIVTGLHDDIVPTLAAHDAVDAVWYFGSAEGSAEVERVSTGNLKRTWVSYGRTTNWMDPHRAEGQEFLRQATHVKNIWIPYGE